MPYLLLGVAILCLSQPANLVRWAQAPIEAVGFWRLFLAAAALSPFAWSRRAGWLSLSSRDRGLTLAAGVFFFIHLWTFFYAAKHTRVANCALAFSVHPLFTAAGAWAFFGERPTARLLAAYLLAGVGLGGLVSGSVAFEAGALAGDLSAVLSAALFSGYVLCGRRVRERLDNAVYASAVFVTAASLFLAAGLARGAAFAGYAADTWAAIAGLALGVTLGGHALFTYLFRFLSVNLLSLAKLLEPIGAAVVAYWAFGEALTARTAIAFACIGGAVALLALAPEPPEAAGEEAEASG